MKPDQQAIRKGLTVIVPTCNPRPGLLSGLINALSKQTISPANWDLVIVDNASSPPLTPILEPLTALGVTCQIITETRPGLTYARLAGCAQASRSLVTMLDDDNVPHDDFLATALDFAEHNPSVGTFGGRVLPQYSSPPPDWFAATGISLGCRDLGGALLIASASPRPKSYPACSPIGAGMVLRREIVQLYVSHIGQFSETITDRQGNDLSSGGDCEIVLVGLFNGWDTAYSPKLRINHIIPASRLDHHYIARLNRASSRSWVILLHRFGLNPWPAISKISLPLRKLKAWVAARAWKGPRQYIAWSGSCGIFEGRASIKPSLEQ